MISEGQVGIYGNARSGMMRCGPAFKTLLDSSNQKKNMWQSLEKIAVNDEVKSVFRVQILRFVDSSMHPTTFVAPFGTVSFLLCKLL